MSASLVGSEMCIRDRGCAACGSEECGPERVTSRFLSVAIGFGASKHAPVSYTHLTLPTICSV
eukprot:12164431-Alexandrium_andersonii.AAC.1